VITDLILAGVSFVGLLLYATVGVVVFRVFMAWREGACRAGGSHGPDAVVPCQEDHDGAAFGAGVFWPLILSGLAFGWLVAKVAVGPTAWGTWLAELGTHRAERKRALKQQVEDRDAHIADLERSNEEFKKELEMAA
jgi:hypothetical protein